MFEAHAYRISRHTALWLYSRSKVIPGFTVELVFSRVTWCMYSCDVSY